MYTFAEMIFSQIFQVHLYLNDIKLYSFIFSFPVSVQKINIHSRDYIVNIHYILKIKVPSSYCTEESDTTV